jgi:hypothetical protein
MPSDASRASPPLEPLDLDALLQTLGTSGHEYAGGELEGFFSPSTPTDFFNAPVSADVDLADLGSAEHDVLPPQHERRWWTATPEPQTPSPKEDMAPLKDITSSVAPSFALSSAMFPTDHLQTISLSDAQIWKALDSSEWTFSWPWTAETATFSPGPKSPAAPIPQPAQYASTAAPGAHGQTLASGRCRSRSGTPSTISTVSPTSTPRPHVWAPPKSASPFGSTSVCNHCKTTNTLQFRHFPEANMLCNACAMFFELHGCLRPL